MLGKIGRRTDLSDLEAHATNLNQVPFGKPVHKLFVLNALIYGKIFGPSDHLPQLLLRLFFQKILVLFINLLPVVKPVRILAELDPGDGVCRILVWRSRHSRRLNPRLSKTNLVFQALN